MLDYSDRVETGRGFVPGLPHAVAQSRRYQGVHVASPCEQEHSDAPWQEQAYTLRMASTPHTPDGTRYPSAPEYETPSTRVRYPETEPRVPEYPENLNILHTRSFSSFVHRGNDI